MRISEIVCTGEMQKERSVAYATSCRWFKSNFRAVLAAMVQRYWRSALTGDRIGSLKIPPRLKIRHIGTIHTVANHNFLPSQRGVLVARLG